MNLKARYGDKYRIAREKGSKPRDPAGFTIPCRRGHPIYAHGRNLLGVATNGRGIVKRLLAVPGLKVTQYGDDGINAVFPPESFAAVAAIVRPKRRRKLSAAHRAKLLAASHGAFAASDGLSNAQGTAANNVRFINVRKRN